MSQRVERIVISRSHPNWKACHRLCGLARRLGNCATYILRHLFIEKKDFPNRQTLDRELREQYPSDYRGMPSAASAQRQGQIIREQFLSFINAKNEVTRKNAESYLLDNDKVIFGVADGVSSHPRNHLASYYLMALLSQCKSFCYYC